MSISTSAGNALLNSFASTYRWVSLHTGNPGSTGGFEVGVSGYARQQITWPSASALTLTWTGSITFPLGAAVTVLYWGVWSAVSGGVWGDGYLLAKPLPLPQAMNVVLVSLQIGPVTG